jgi:hypothetical protein
MRYKQYTRPGWRRHGLGGPKPEDRKLDNAGFGAITGGSRLWSLNRRMPKAEGRRKEEIGPHVR